MTISVFPKGELTPQQILAACLNDEIENIEKVFVCRITKDGNLIWSWSHALNSELAWVGSALVDLSMRRTFE